MLITELLFSEYISLKMKHTIVLLFTMLYLASCNLPTEYPVPENEKPADIFARHFFENMTRGQKDSCFYSMYPESQNDQVKSEIISASNDLAGDTIITCKVVGYTVTKTLTTGIGNVSSYTINYEYQLSNKRIFFVARIFKKDGAFYITSFTGEHITQAVEEMNSFSLIGKTPVHYSFLMLTIAIPVFILITLFNLLFSKITTKKKALWAFIIVFCCLPKFYINWGTGETGFQLINLSLFGAGYLKTSLYTPWIVFFNFPLGAVIYWVKRKNLLIQPNTEIPVDPVIVYESKDIAPQEIDSMDHTRFMPKDAGDGNP